MQIFSYWLHDVPKYELCVGWRQMQIFVESETSVSLLVSRWMHQRSTSASPFSVSTTPTLALCAMRSMINIVDICFALEVRGNEERTQIKQCEMWPTNQKWRRTNVLSLMSAAYKSNSPKSPINSGVFGILQRGRKKMFLIRCIILQKVDVSKGGHRRMAIPPKYASAD